MAWETLATLLFRDWVRGLERQEARSVGIAVRLLENLGPHLGHPQTSGIMGSRHSHMRELRIQHAGRPFRVLYAFDPLRRAVLLLGGDKTGNNRWYRENVPIADRLYDEHLEHLREDGEI